MRDPLQRLKYLPWLELFQVAALTTLLVTVLDLVLIQILVTAFPQPSVFFGPLGILLLFVSAIGIGALAVYLTERFFRQVHINAGILWALAFCLTLLLFIKTYLQIPTFLTGISYPQFIGVILGVSFKGRRYWR